MFRLALIQMLVVAGEKARNLRHAEELIAQAASGGAQVVLLPECMDLGWTDVSAKPHASPIPDGDVCRALCESARRHRVYVCSGLTERDGERVYNAAVLIDPQGQVLLKHRKLNELDIGHGFYDQGDRLNVCHTELGTFGVMICADATAKDRVLTRSLGYMGADVILSPSAWAVPARHDNAKEPYGQLWRDAYRPVASEFSIWIASASNVGWMTGGPWKGWKCIGCSMAVGPEGQEVVNGPYGAEAETLLYVDVTPVPRPARGTGWHEHWGRSG